RRRVLRHIRSHRKRGRAAQRLRRIRPARLRSAYRKREVILSGRGLKRNGEFPRKASHLPERIRAELVRILTSRDSPRHLVAVGFEKRQPHRVDTFDSVAVVRVVGRPTKVHAYHALIPLADTHRSGPTDACSIRGEAL